MDRRDFFRILSATSGSVLAGCGSKSDKLIPLLVAEHEIAPGEEQWHPAVCSECAAGCGTLVRVMEGVRTIERNGEEVRQRIAAIKKIEGNPLDPVSGGHLCARGQAAVQALYHPDRLRGPMRRSGERGGAQFTPISWDEAIASAAERLAPARSANPGGIVFLTGPQTGTRSSTIERFMTALGAPAPVVCSLAGFPVERHAAELVFGWTGLTVYDLAHARYALGVGADFLGGWASPVFYNKQFGDFRRGRSEVRGRLVQAESRLSITAAAADQWLPLRPGSEPQFLAAVAKILLDSGSARESRLLPAAVREQFQSVDVAGMLAICGVSERRAREMVKELGDSEAPLVIAGASMLHSNSLDAIVASHYLNLMLGNVGKPGGVLPPAVAPAAPLTNYGVAAALARAEVILIDGANPAYILPRSTGVLDVLARAKTVIGFGTFLDDSAAFCDLLLPDHHGLETEAAVVPAVSKQTAVTISTPFVQPLYDTRAMDKTLAAITVKMEVPYEPVSPKNMVQPLLADDKAYDDVAREGGLWVESSPAPVAHPPNAKLDLTSSEFSGTPNEYPLQFQPYLSLQYHEGSGANLPWLQELPDPASSAIWGLPVEIDPKTAARLRISNGDVVRVESQHGWFEAAAYVHPGAAPEVVSMPIGDGHTHYGRYASGRGANPLSILAPVWEKSTGALVMGGTRVRLARVSSPRAFTQFSALDRRERDFDHR